MSSLIEVDAMLASVIHFIDASVRPKYGHYSHVFGAKRSSLCLKFNIYENKEKEEENECRNINNEDCYGRYYSPPGSIE